MQAPDAAKDPSGSCVRPSDRHHVQPLAWTEPIVPPWQQKIILQQVKGCNRWHTSSSAARAWCNPAAAVFGARLPSEEMLVPRNAAWLREAVSLQRLHSQCWSCSPGGASCAGKYSSYSSFCKVWRLGNGEYIGQDERQGNMLCIALNFQE